MALRDRLGELLQRGLAAIEEGVSAVVRGAAGQTQLTWVCALVRTCPDCLPRHRDTRSMEEWAAEGMPGTGWSVCGEHCMCQLVPEEQGRDIEPLRRVRVSQRGLTVRVPDTLVQRRTDVVNLRIRYQQDPAVRRAFRILGSQNA